MIRRLRIRHRWMILIVTVVCLAVYTMAVFARTPARRTGSPAVLRPEAGR